MVLNERWNAGQCSRSSARRSFSPGRTASRPQAPEQTASFQDLIYEHVRRVGTAGVIVNAPLPYGIAGVASPREVI